MGHDPKNHTPTLDLEPRKKAPNPFGFEVSIIQCRRWDLNPHEVAPARF